MTAASRSAGWAGAAALGATLLCAWPARAEPDPITAVGQAAIEALLELNFHSQMQAGLFAVSANDLRAGGAGARIGFNAMGFGGSLGGRMEKYAPGAGALATLDFEFRPLPFLRENLYRTVDPFVSVGLEAGGGARGGRATQTLGAGVDLGLFGHPESNREVVQPVLTLRYEYRLWQIPEDLPQHLVLVGAATRICF